MNVMSIGVEGRDCRSHSSAATMSPAAAPAAAVGADATTTATDCNYHCCNWEFTSSTSTSMTVNPCYMHSSTTALPVKPFSSN